VTAPWAWPENFEGLKLGEGCPMCASEGAAETPHGVRVFEGRWCDGYLSRYPMRPGYTVVIWKGRHVAEPGELSPEEAAGFWGEVASVADAVEAEYRPVKMNWLHLGNGVPHLHAHVVPRTIDDVHAGGPLEEGAFNQAETPELGGDALAGEVAALRARLSR
jgi:diadenosine tetraphosphate (Ap4A) HIT family hydrolase